MLVLIGAMKTKPRVSIQGCRQLTYRRPRLFHIFRLPRYHLAGILQLSKRRGTSQENHIILRQPDRYRSSADTNRLLLYKGYHVTTHVAAVNTIDVIPYVLSLLKASFTTAGAFKQHRRRAF